MRRIHARRSAKLFATLSAVSIAGIFLLNLVVDPFDILEISIPHVNTLKPDLHEYSPVVKAAGVIRRKPDHILLGSSVVDHAFHFPGSTAVSYDGGFHHKHEAMLKMLPEGMDFYNASIRGGGPYEVEVMFDHALKNNPNLKYVVIGIEWGLFTSVKPLMPDKPLPDAIGKTRLPADMIVNHTLTWDALVESLIVLRRNDITLPLRWVYKKLFWDDWMGAHAAEPVADGTPNPVIAEREEDTGLTLFSLSFAQDVRDRVDGKGAQEAYIPERIDYIRRIVEECKKRGIRVDIYIGPQHAMYWAASRQAGIIQYRDDWIRGLAGIAPLWDFSGAIDFSDKLPDYFSTDPLHFSQMAADVILPAIVHGKSDPSKGIYLVTKDTVEAAIKRRDQQLDVWLNRHPYYKKLMAAIRGKRFNNAMQVPVKYTPDYHGYTIVGMMGHFYALKPKEGKYDMLTVLQSDPPRADTMEGIMKRIDGKMP